MIRRFTREEFYALVWSKPLTHLATEFALSDVALHKICRRHGIPHPPAGWWAKKAAGKPVRQTPLPKPETGMPLQVLIRPGARANEPESLSAAREAAQMLAAADGPAGPPAPLPLADKTVAALARAKLGERGLVSVSGPKLISCTVAPQSVARLATLLPQLAQAAALQGFTLAPGEQAVRFVRDGETVGFAITEEVQREKHEMTEAEQAKLEAWELKRARARARNPWDWRSDGGRPIFPEWDYYPTGRLTLELEHLWLIGSTPRRTFRDGKVQRLESLLGDVAIGIAMLAAAKAEDQRQRAERARREEEERRRREIAARAAHITERRGKALAAILAEAEELERLRRLLVGLAPAPGVPASPRVATFTNWAADYLASCDARLSADGLEQRFIADQLFGDSDDHAYRPSHW